MAWSNEYYFWYAGRKQDGEWQLRKVPADTWEDKDSVVLVERFEGSIADIKLEFDGRFYRDFAKNHFLLSTYQSPWVFILLEDGRLYTKHPEEPVSAATLLNDNVTRISPCRGWVSEDGSLDMGLFCGYIKNGIPYYAVYRKSATGTYGWESDIRVADITDATDIKVFRLNDYRMGIWVKSSTKSQIFISYRLYIGGTVEASYFSGSIHPLDFTMLNPSRTSDPDYYQDLNPTATLEWAGSNMAVRCRFKYPIVSLDTRFQTVNEPTAPVGYTFTSIAIDSGDLLLTLDKPLGSLHSHLKFTTHEFNRCQFQVTPYCKPALPALTLETKSLEYSYQETFAGAAYDITASLPAYKKRTLRSEIVEQFQGDVQSAAANLEVKRHEYINASSNEFFNASALSCSASIEYEFSGKIIG